jgi:integrase
VAEVAKRGSSWRVRWYEPGGARRSRTFPRKVDADRWAVKVTHDQHSGTYVSHDAGRVTFKAYAEEWRAAKAHRKSTAEQVESHLRNHVYPVLGDRPIGSITPREIQALVTGCTLGPVATETVYAYTANVFKWAVRDRLIASTPCVGIELPEQEDAPLELLTAGQVRTVRDSIDPRHRIFVVIASGSGLRPSEITGLRLDRVDVKRKTITVDAQLATIVGERPHLAPPKTKASNRVVPVPVSVVDAIEAHVGEYGIGPLGLIMSTRQGQPVRRGRLGQSWSAARRKGKLPGWATPHDLRHFYASALIALGLDVKTVQKRLGHKSALTTLDIYGHLWPDSEDRTREAIEAALSELEGPQRDHD